MPCETNSSAQRSVSKISAAFAAPYWPDIAYGQLARRRLMAGAFLSAGDYVQAARRRLEMIGAVEDALRDVDILLCASAMDPPSRIDDPAEVERSGMATRSRHQHKAFAGEPTS